MTDSSGRFAFALDRWDRTAPGILRANAGATLVGELSLPSDPPEGPLEDLVVRRPEAPSGPPEALPDLLLRPIDGATGRALCEVWGTVELFAGGEVAARAVCRSDPSGVAHLWGFALGDVPPAVRFDRAYVEWQVEGFEGGVQHLVDLTGRKDGDSIVQRLTPNTDSLLVHGMVLRDSEAIAGAEVAGAEVAGAEVAGAEVRVQRLGDERPDRARHSSDTRTRTDADGRFALRAAAVDGSAVRVWATTAAGEWAAFEATTARDGGTLECVLRIEPHVSVGAVLTGAQPGLHYSMEVEVEGPSGSPFLPLRIPAQPLELDPQAEATTLLRLPASRRAKVHFTAREDGEVADSAGGFDWDPSSGLPKDPIRLQSHFVVVDGRVAGFTSDELPALLVVASRPSSDRHTVNADVADDGSFEFTTRRGSVTLALLRPRPAGAGYEVLTTALVELSEPRAEVVLQRAR